jgi:PTH1 family peptidyl-tRNA hydrolase
LIAGLGNPGLRYKETRHNVGFQVVRAFGKQLGVELSGRRFQSKNVLTEVRRQKVLLLCPQTFMNLSGISLRACVDYFKIDPADMLVIHDDLDLPVGRIKAVGNGGAGGHKGILSIVQHLGTHEFARLKIGIGRPRYRELIEDFVLNPFYSEERETIAQVIESAVEAVTFFLWHGIDKTMGQFNHLGKDLADPEKA